MSDKNPRQEPDTQGVPQGGCSHAPLKKDWARHLNPPTLRYRRVRGNMIEMYKILRGMYDPEASSFIKLNSSDWRGHNMKNYLEHIRLNIRKHSFIHCSADLCNNLYQLRWLPPRVLVFQYLHDLRGGWMHYMVRGTFQAYDPDAELSASQCMHIIG